MGSPGRPGAAAGPKPDFTNQLVMLLAFMVALFIMFDNDLRQSLGKAMGVVLSPLVSFDGHIPVLTLIFTGLIMSIFSITVRHFFIDWVGQARNQRIGSAFQKELREARQSNNTYKLKKLMELQPQMMQQQLKASQTQLRLMPVTLIVIIPIFAWLSNFVYVDLSYTVFSVPWEHNASMESTNVLPNWILLYSLMTIPFGQVVTRLLKYLSFAKRLRALGEEETSGIRKADEGTAR